MLTLVQLVPILSVVWGAAIVEIQSNDRFEYFVPTAEEALLKEHKTFWNNEATLQLKKNVKIDEDPKIRVAKNVVVMIGDGMGISTITAARIYKGQRTFRKSGEDHRLSYDDFPNVALVKTYNVDMQVPDSAGTATALFTGVKTRYEALGVDVTANRKDPDPDVYKNSKLESIMTWAQRANKDTGIITTTRITHATPAATYSQVHFREWECDSEVPKEFKPFVKDIAAQLIEDAPGNKFKVILGGGYQQLGYITEDQSDNCIREDRRNLTQTWLDKHKDLNAAFVTNNQQLAEVKDVDYLLGLFYHDHVPYELLRDKSPSGTPSLTEMTKKGLQVLKKSENGFVLMIEGGRIDHGHHDTSARLALEEASEFDKAVALVVEETGPETLIIVTADHSHTLTLNGYSKRGNDILGYTINDDEDVHPALTLSYANGPGFRYHYTPNNLTVLGPWRDPRNDSNRLNDPKYVHLGSIELDDETHGGEDVGIFATGPGAHLFRGVIEQNYVAHVISYAACIGPNANLNPNCDGSSSAADAACNLSLILFVLVTCKLLSY